MNEPIENEVCARPVHAGLRLAGAAALAMCLAGMVPASAIAEDAVRSISGSITWVSADAVEISGQRALVTQESTVTSDGRGVSLASIRRGMPAQAEIDDAGRLIALYVNGVVE